MEKKKSNPDSNPLRVLILEDIPADAELVERELRRGGIDFTSRLVKGKREYSKALAEFQPQIILSDFKLPKFDGLAALEIACTQVPDVPFIFVSGSIGEEKAIKLLTQGASDYIFKDNLQRLGPAVKRVVEASRLQLEKKNSNEKLLHHVEELRLLAEAADRFVQINDLDEMYEYLAQVIRDISGTDYLLLSLYDDKLQAVKPKIVTGFKPFRETLRRRFHFDPMQMVLYLKDMRKDAFSDFVSRRLLPVRDGLYGLANRKLPRQLCRTIEKLLDIGSMCTMGFSWENQLYGSLTVFFKKGNELKNHAQIETLLNQAAVSIKRLLAEKSLRESEEKYRLNFEYSPLGLLSFDEKGVIVACNDNFVKIIGSSREVLIGLNMLNLSDKNIVSAVQKALSGSQGFYEGLYSSVTAKKITPIRCRFASINVGGGGIPGGVGIIEDITERKRVEIIQQIQYTIANAVATAETFFSLFKTIRNELNALFDTTNFLVALYDEASGMLSAPFEKDEKELIPQWPAEKSLTGLVIREKQSILLSKEQIRQMSQTGKIELIGSRAETWLGVPLQINEKILGAIVLQNYDRADAYDQNTINILEIVASQSSVYIERKQAEAEILRQKAFLEKLVESAPEGIAITDCPGRVLQVNSEFVRMFGYEADEAVGKMIDDLLVPPGYQEEAGRLTQISGSGEKIILETVRKRKDGIFFNVSIIGAPINIGEQQVAVYAIYRDITERKGAEEQIQYQASLLQNVSDAIIATDTDGNIQVWNKAAEKIYGWKKEEIIGKKFHEMINPEYRYQSREEVFEKLNQEGVWSGEIVHHFRDGKQISVHSTITILKDAAGDKTGFVSVNHDISARKEAEAAFLQEKAFLDQLVESAPEAIVLAENNGQILQINSEFEKMFGYSAEEAVGRLIDDLVAPPEYQRQATNITQTVAQGEKFSLETVRRRKDGSLLHVSLVGSPIIIGGEQVAAYGIYRDISDRKLAEEALRMSEERLRDIIFSMADWVWETDENGVYTYSSQKGFDFFGPAQENIIGKTPFDFMPAEEAKRVAVLFSEIMANNEPIKDLENWNITKNGERICLLTNGVPILDKEGNLKGYRGVDKDITERMHNEEQIRASLKEKEVLLQEIHHRVKNNLQIISGLLTLQAEQSAGKSLDDIFRASQDRIRSIALIHEKLYRSQNLAEIAFDEYLRDLTENLFLSHGVAAGRITAKYEMEPILFTIEKAIPLGLIVNELVTNALKHAFPAGQQGEIRIELHGYKNAKSYALKTDSGTLHCVPSCELIVTDSGVGLPAVFEPDTKKSLGMNLVSMLAKQIQAELKVKTGPGTEFRLIFPGLPAKEAVKGNNHSG